MPDLTTRALIGAAVLVFGCASLAGCTADDDAGGVGSGDGQVVASRTPGSPPVVQLTADADVPVGVRQLWADATVEAVYAVDRVWDSAMPTQVRVVLAGSAERFTDLSGVTEPGQVPAAVSPGSDRSVVIHPDAWTHLDERGRLLVLTHEVTHLVIDGDGGLPWWLAEGAAEYTAYRDEQDRNAVLGPTLMDRLADAPAPDWPISGPGTTGAGADSAPADDPTRSQRYAAAWLAVEFLVDRYGEEPVLEMTLAVGRGERLDDAAKHYLGVQIADLEEPWSAWWDLEIRDADRSR